MSLWMTTYVRCLTRGCALNKAVQAFNAVRAAAESMFGERELSMGEMHDICEYDDTKLRTAVPYRPTSSWVAGQMIGVLTNAVRTTPATRACWMDAFRTARTPTKTQDELTLYYMFRKMNYHRSV